MNEIYTDLEQPRKRKTWMFKNAIEKEGWKDITLKQSEGWHFAKNGNRVQYNIDTNTLFVANGINIVFKGKCPDIETFRLIIKLVI